MFNNLDIEYYLSIADEAIAVQKNTVLGTNLTKMFKKCYEIRNKEYTKDMSGGELTKLITKVSNYIKKELPKITLNDVGFTVREIEFNNKTPTGLVAIDYYTYFSIDTIDRVESALRGDPVISKMNKSNSSKLKQLLSITDTYDTTTGKFKGEQWGVKFWIDTSLFIFLDVFYPKVTPLLPEEAAAIMLHEIGHISIVAERASAMMYVAKTVDDNIKKLSRTTFSITDCITYINEECLPLCNYVITKGMAATDRTNAEYCKKVLTTMLSIASQLDDGSKKATGSNIKYIPGYILAIFGKLAGMIFILISRILFTPFTMIYSLLPELGGLNSTKVSDIKYTGHNEYLLERSSDEFVVRHGYGVYLASGLDKILSLFYDYKGNNELIAHSKLLDILTKINASIDGFGLPNYPYENNDQRIRRIIQATMAIFKDTRISPKFRNAQLAGLQRTMALLDKQGTDLYNRRSVDALKRVFETLLLPEDWIRIMTSGRLTQEYERQFNQMEDLINNAMYGHYAQLKKLIDSK